MFEGTGFTIYVQLTSYLAVGGLCTYFGYMHMLQVKLHLSSFASSGIN